MSAVNVRITHRTEMGDRAMEKSIEIDVGHPPTTNLTLVVEGERTAGAVSRILNIAQAGTGEEPDFVTGDTSDMAEALAKVSQELGCSNTLDDMLHAIDALRTDKPAPLLEWSHTLCDRERVSYAAAEKACAALGEGWRLPTRMELESILDLTRHDPAVDTARFPDTKSGWYWSSTPCAFSSDDAWIVSFGYGYADNLHRDDLNAFVRAVRALPAGQ